MISVTRFDTLDNFDLPFHWRITPGGNGGVAS